MPLTPEQITQINESNRDRVTRALQHLADAKSSGNHIDNPQIRELEAALRTRLAQLDHMEGAQRVSKTVEDVMAIINGEVQSDPRASIKTDS